MRVLYFIFAYSSMVFGQPSELTKIRDFNRDSGNKCKVIESSFGRVSVSGPAGALSVHLTKNKKRISSVYLPSFGTGSQRCVDLQYFKKHNLVVFKVYKGTSSPAAIESTVLIAYRLTKNRIELLKSEFEIVAEDQEDIVYLKSYKFKETDDNVILQLTEELEPETKGLMEEHKLLIDGP